MTSWSKFCDSYEIFLPVILGAVLIAGVILLFQNWLDERKVRKLCDQPIFSRRRRKRQPLTENVSVAMSTQLKDDLVCTSGNQQSKYIRASLRLALPTLRDNPILVDILDEE